MCWSEFRGKVHATRLPSGPLLSAEGDSWPSSNPCLCNGSLLLPLRVECVFLPHEYGLAFDLPQSTARGKSDVV